MKRKFRWLTMCTVPLLMAAPMALANSSRPDLNPAQTPGTTLLTAFSQADEGDTSAASRRPGALDALATGTVLHADVLSTGGEASLVGVEVAFSGAAYSAGEAAEQAANEMDRLVTPILKAKGAHGRGDGLELGVGGPPEALIGELAEATAPPSTELVKKLIGPISLPGILELELLEGQAQARSADQGCVLGSNLSYGLGNVLGLELLDGLVETAATPPVREVSQSSSRTAIVPGEGSRLALMSETRQTIAPVTFFSGTDNQFTIEILGEWVLRTVADGSQSSVHYGPTEASPSTPVLRILDAKGAEMGSLTLQQFLGKEGLELTIPGVASVVVGEDPRAIDGDGASQPLLQATEAAAAVDVVRVDLLDGQLADVRLGHMETSVTVPGGGVSCPGIEVEQRPEPAQVEPGDTFTYVIDVTNPNEGTLSDVNVVETVTVPSGCKINIVSGPGVSPSGNTATFDAIPTMAAGETKQFTVTVEVLPDSAACTLKAEAVADGTYVAPPDGPDAGLGSVPVEGRDDVDGPEIGGLACIVPDLVGTSFSDLEDLLVKAGCKLGDITQDPNADPADIGKVTNQDPAAQTEALPGTEVDVTIGGQGCLVPNLAGVASTEVKATLEEAGCKLGDVTDAGGANPDNVGKVADQNPPGGTSLPLGSDVDVSIGGPSCVVPDLLGMTETEARQVVEAAGCTLAVQTGPSATPADVGRATGQSPEPGAVQPVGSTVTVTLGGPIVAGAADVAAAGDSGRGVLTLPGTLPRTGGIAFSGLALALVGSGLFLRLTGGRRK